MIYLSRVWVIRFGNFGEFADECKNKGVIVIGWDKVGNISSINSKDELREKLYNSYRENYKREASAGVAASMLWQFSREPSPNDIVISPRKDTREILVGTVEDSKYIFDPNLILYKVQIVLFAKDSWHLVIRTRETVSVEVFEKPHIALTDMRYF